MISICGFTAIAQRAVEDEFWRLDREYELAGGKPIPWQLSALAKPIRKPKRLFKARQSVHICDLLKLRSPASIAQLRRWHPNCRCPRQVAIPGLTQ